MAAGRTAAAVMVLIVASLLIGQVLGQPVLLGFVETGSMAPTLDPGDGFIAIPSALAGPVEPGDVVVFDAENLHGGGLVTHRVISETDQGFITKGDANPVNDQESSIREPPVQDQQIVAEVLQIGGTVVVIPQIGLLVTGTNAILGGVQGRLAALFGTRAFLGTQGLAYLLFAVGVMAYLVTMALERGKPAPRERSRRSRRKDSVNASLIVLALTLALVA
ncbi:MAG: signal peptidase I, partial [Halobacteriales archaeon]|nr:signal peptidase I [Halobacteriales archaeon]